MTTAAALTVPAAPPVESINSAGGAALLDAVVSFVRRYVVMSEAQAHAVALWIAHTHAVDASDCTPYLHISSPEKRSGKSRLLDVIELLAARPMKAADVSEAALFRGITLREGHLTLLLDEVDTIFGPHVKNHEGLRGLLNAGYRRGTPVWRIVGEGAKMKLGEFDCFCPKALAGIGELPDTIADRSLRIRLQRRAREETVERFRYRDASASAGELRAAVGEWLAGTIEHLKDARPELPEALDDRGQDAVEPLLAIADRAGEEWPTRAREAFVALRGGNEEDERDSLGVKLLTDLHHHFTAAEWNAVSTADLLHKLTSDEEAPWGHFRDGQPMKPRQLGNMLRRYGIRSKTVYLGRDDEGRDKSAKGFQRDQFEDTWRRYLTSDPSGPSGPASQAGLRVISDPSGDPSPDGYETGSNPHEQTDLTDLTDGTRDEGQEGTAATVIDWPKAGLAGEQGVLQELRALARAGQLEGALEGGPQ